jgi:uncharacterized membrane protein (GlpM family)
MRRRVRADSPLAPPASNAAIEEVTVKAAEIALRFLLGGTLVAGIPLVARTLGPKPAGLLTLLPVITLSSFYFIAADEGRADAIRAVRSALLALPVLVVYLVVTFLALRSRSIALLPALGLGLLGWLGAAGLALWVLP